LLKMSAQSCGSTAFDGPHDASLLWRQRVRQAELITVLTKDVGHLQRRPQLQQRPASTL
jgi:hypothetical protein